MCIRDRDLSHEFGIGVDAGLNIEKVTPEIMQRFVADFNADNLKLDESLYSFQMNNDDFETWALKKIKNTLNSLIVAYICGPK